MICIFVKGDWVKYSCEEEIQTKYEGYVSMHLPVNLSSFLLPLFLYVDMIAAI
jgi:hypothetical protein